MPYTSIMKLSTSNLVLRPDAPIDLQLHTIYSDGTWTPAELIEYLVNEQFALAAITDHDRPDTAAALQQLAHAAQMPLLVAVEMTTTWHGGMVDILCYGIGLHQQPIIEIAHDLVRRQRENTHQVYQQLCRASYLTEQPDELQALLDTPSAQQPHALVALVKHYGSGNLEKTAGTIVLEAGCIFATNDTASVVGAAHQSGAVCLIAHPGRGDEFLCFDGLLLDQFRHEIPIDGLEVYYPRHTPEQTNLYEQYAQHHRLLVSAGSDSHGPAKKPVKYRAELCRNLLERMGIKVQL